MQRRSRTIAGAALCLVLGLSLQGCSETVKAHIKKGAQEVWNTAIQGACSTAIDAIINPLRDIYVGTGVTAKACTAITDPVSKQACTTQFNAQIDADTTTKKTQFKTDCTTKMGNCTGQDWGLSKIKTCIDNYQNTSMKAIYDGAKATFDNKLAQYTYSAKQVRLFEVKEEGGIVSSATPVLLASVAAASALLAVALYVRAQRASRDVQVVSAQDGDDELLEDGYDGGLE